MYDSIWNTPVNVCKTKETYITGPSWATALSILITTETKSALAQMISHVHAEAKHMCCPSVVQFLIKFSWHTHKRMSLGYKEDKNSRLRLKTLHFCNIVGGDVAFSFSCLGPSIPPITLSVIDNLQNFSFLEAEVLICSGIIIIQCHKQFHIGSRFWSGHGWGHSHWVAGRERGWGFGCRGRTWDGTIVTVWRLGHTTSWWLRELARVLRPAQAIPHGGITHTRMNPD